MTLQESEAGYCGADGFIDSVHTGYRGAGFVDGGNFTGAEIKWQVDASETNTYAVTVRYANGANSARSGTLTANDNSGAAAIFNLNSTGVWAAWREETRDITLSAGANALVLAANGSEGLANIDSISIAGPGLKAGECPKVAVPDAGDTGALIGFATLNGGTTGGKGGETVSASSYSQLKSYAESSKPYIIKVNGTISNGSGGGQINVQSNKSLIGVGSTAFLQGVGLNITKNNIIIQNLKMTLVGTNSPSRVNGGDVISINGSAKNIWVDHCELYSENPNVQKSKDKYDGLIDIKHKTGFITLSWNYLHDHHKGGLVGSSESDLYGDRKVTMHHNYYNRVKLRVPMYRGSTGHFFNNYIVGADKASEIRNGACVRIEKNYYEALNFSIYTPSDYVGRVERIDNIESSNRAYPPGCKADIPYSYSSVLTNKTSDVKIVVPQNAGVGKI